jgi:hypothetical protein
MIHYTTGLKYIAVLVADFYFILSAIATVITQNFADTSLTNLRAFKVP